MGERGKGLKWMEAILAKITVISHASLLAVSRVLVGIHLDTPATLNLSGSQSLS